MELELGNRIQTSTTGVRVLEGELSESILLAAGAVFAGAVPWAQLGR